MAIHNGPVKSTTNEVSGRQEYTGETLNITKSLEHMAHGGQILTTLETWNIASSFSESLLGGPQALDLGGHVLQKGAKSYDGVISKQIVQLVPCELAYDYFDARRQLDGQQGGERCDESGCDNDFLQERTGRQFPPVKTLRQVSASFHDAPYLNNEVTIAFLSTCEVENHYDDAETRLTALSRFVAHLLHTFSGGYQCKSSMLAFSSCEEGIRFGLRLMDALQQCEDKLLEGAPVAPCFLRYGCMHGPYDTMGANPMTGRADYFGRVVNRAARIASAAELGTVCVGVVASEELVLDDPTGIRTVPMGTKRLKGLQEDMSLYLCTQEL